MLPESTRKSAIAQGCAQNFSLGGKAEGLKIEAEGGEVLGERQQAPPHQLGVLGTWAASPF